MADRDPRAIVHREAFPAVAGATDPIRPLPSTSTPLMSAIVPGSPHKYNQNSHLLEQRETRQFSKVTLRSQDAREHCSTAFAWPDQLPSSAAIGSDARVAGRNTKARHFDQHRRRHAGSSRVMDHSWYRRGLRRRRCRPIQAASTDDESDDEGDHGAVNDFGRKGPVAVGDASLMVFTTVTR